MHSILAVDDSPSMRQMVSFTLKNAGFNVVEAVDGQDAWEKANLRDFNLVLTDQNMPRMDGISLTRKLRENPKFKSTPILILTTESSDQMKQSGRSAGATGWLVKPFDPAKLIEVIGKVIR
jgi:two-component system chemotaxis response regulator CheY